jgi:hypothetical protein
MTKGAKKSSLLLGLDARLAGALLLPWHRLSFSLS